MDDKVREALRIVQNELKAPKDKVNSFGKYNYRSCESILENVKPLLAKVGAALTIEDEIVQVSDRVYVRATATFYAEGGEVRVTAYAREADTKSGMDVAQVTGAASSYARKYALNGLFAIDDTKDPDTEEYQGQPAKPQPKPTVAPQPKPTAAPQSASLNDAMKSVWNAVREAQTVAQLVDMFNELKKRDKDLAELMRADFKKRQQELTTL